VEMTEGEFGILVVATRSYSETGGEYVEEVFPLTKAGAVPKKATDFIAKLTANGAKNRIQRIKEEKSGNFDGYPGGSATSIPDYGAGEEEDGYGV